VAQIPAVVELARQREMRFSEFTGTKEDGRVRAQQILSTA
jgi:hypothetical protein